MVARQLEIDIARTIYDPNKNIQPISDPNYQRLLGFLDPKSAPSSQDVKQLIAMLSGDTAGMMSAGLDGVTANDLLERQYPQSDHPNCRKIIKELDRIRELLRMTNAEGDLPKHLKAVAGKIQREVVVGREPKAVYLYAALVGEANVRSGEFARKELRDMNYEEQKRYVRGVIGGIEKNFILQLTYTQSNKNIFDQILSDPHLDERLKKELMARIYVNDCYFLFSSAEGRIKVDLQKSIFPPGTMANLDMAAREAFTNKRELTGEQLKVLFGPKFDQSNHCVLTEGMNGVRIDNAWNELQIANSDKYKNMVSDACDFLGIASDKRMAMLDADTYKTTVDNDPWLGVSASINFATDTNSERKQIVRNYIKSKIGGEDPEDALLLAERLRVTLGEDYSANRNVQAGTDQVAELIGFWPKVFSDFRTGKKRPVIAPIILQGVFSLTTSFARQKAMELDPSVLNPAKCLLAHQLNFDIKPGDLVAYYTRELPTAKRVADDVIAITPEKSKYMTLADNSFASACDRVDKINKAAREISLADPKILQSLEAELSLQKKTAKDKRDISALEQLIDTVKKIRNRKTPIRLRQISVASDLKGLATQGYNLDTFNMIRDAVVPVTTRGGSDKFLTMEEWLEASKDSWFRFTFGTNKL